LFVCVLAALVLERWQAWLATGFTTLLWGAVGWRWTQGQALPVDPFADPNDASNWMRIIVIFTLFSCATVGCIQFLVTRLERAQERSEALYEALQDESTRRLQEQQNRHAMELRLQHAQKLEALGTLAGTMAHDVNNLLQVISANAQLALTESDMERRLAAELDLRTASDRAANLTRQLLAFSQHRSAETRAIHVRRAAKESLRLVAPLVPTLDVTFTSEGDLPAVQGSASTVHQIVMNLVLNARDAMPEGGRVTVRTYPASRLEGSVERSFAVVSVKDEGSGMDAVFDPFFTTKNSGTGLGLHLVQSLAQSTGGRVEIASELGKGTEVRVFLAGTDDSTSSTPDVKDRTEERRPGAGRCILVVDDDPLVRRALCRFLENGGYEVVGAGNGVIALELFCAEPGRFAAVVSDAMMPEMAGKELYDELVAVRPDLPFLVCSGYTADVFEHGFFDGRTRRFLAKPFRREDLMRHLAELLDA
jgi:signal transduction histidine kinase/CheY-like chemotaxis protein